MLSLRGLLFLVTIAFFLAVAILLFTGYILWDDIVRNAVIAIGSSLIALNLLVRAVEKAMEEGGL